MRGEIGLMQNRFKKNLLVAITGGIGSGKTTLSNLIKAKGYKVFSCDEICAEIYKKRGFLKKLKKIFPSAVDGRVFLSANKKVIREQTFNNEENLKKLNALLHPIIMKKLMGSLKKQRGIVFGEVPLLFEGGFEDLFDEVIVVIREKTEKVKSVKNRSGLTDAEIEEVMNAQIDYNSTDFSKYIVVKNDGDLSNLNEKAKAVISSLINKYKEVRK